MCVILWLTLHWKLTISCNLASTACWFGHHETWGSCPVQCICLQPTLCPLLYRRWIRMTFPFSSPRNYTFAAMLLSARVLWLCVVFFNFYIKTIIKKIPPTALLLQCQTLSLFFDFRQKLFSSVAKICSVVVRARSVLREAWIRSSRTRISIRFSLKLDRIGYVNIRSQPPRLTSLDTATSHQNERTELAKYWLISKIILLVNLAEHHLRLLQQISR